MNKFIKMEELIKKLKDGTITGDELAFLLKMFRNKKFPDELQEFFGEKWDSSSLTTRDMNPENVWESIVQKITNTERILSRQHVSSGRKRSLVKTWMKYAAVFVSAFGLAWFLHTIIKPGPVIESDKYSKIEVSYGSKSRIELPDGTLVNLNSGSFIRYPEIFTRDNREVYFEGEAFFDVKKDRKRPFIVHTSDIHIRVLGTRFNVKAYPDEGEIETTLIEGKVEVYYKSEESTENKTVILQPNHKIVIQKPIKYQDNTKKENSESANQMAMKKPVRSEYIPKPELYTSWKDNKLEFDNERFEDLITLFERWYDVNIVLMDSEIKNARLSGKFEKETVEQALKALTLTVPFSYEMDKNVITIYPKINKY